MLTRFLDWLDESAAGVIRIAYLAAGVIAVASYFADGATHIPAWLTAFLTAALPWTLAGALEIHTYLTARRVRRAWQDKTAAALGSDEHEAAASTLRVNLWILGGLLAFSMYNQLQYLAQTWTPPATPLTPPGPWAYLIRATITPAAFMAAAFLAPVGEGMAARVQAEASYLTAAAFKAAAQQWKRKLREMQRNGQDITAALVHLVDDPKERRVIQTIWQSMHPGELPPGQVAIAEAIPASAITPPIEAAPPVALPTTPAREPDRPPTGPGSPMPAKARQRPRSASRDAAKVLRLTPDGPARQAARARSHTLPVRTPATPARDRAAKVWRPGMSVSELERAAGIARSTAARYVPEFTANPPAASTETAI